MWSTVRSLYCKTQFKGYFILNTVFSANSCFNANPFMSTSLHVYFPDYLMQSCHHFTSCYLSVSANANTVHTVWITEGKRTSQIVSNSFLLREKWAKTSLSYCWQKWWLKYLQTHAVSMRISACHHSVAQLLTLWGLEMQIVVWSNSTLGRTENVGGILHLAN